MKNQLPDELGAAEAARLLGVKLPTLYAYVSRGLLRSLPGRSGRARRYLRSDVEALRERGPSVRAAAGALRWGEPILESSITAMTPAGPAYRGRLATELARDGTSFEAVAELLWTGVLPAEPPRGRPRPAPSSTACCRCCRRMRRTPRSSPCWSLRARCATRAASTPRPRACCRARAA